MKVSVFMDVLSHWCLAAWPAFEAARRECDAELRLAPLNDGRPIGFAPEAERWFYKRGSLAYGTDLRSDWYESDSTTTLYANAAVAAAAFLGADLPQVAAGAMRAAMEDGAKLGRRDTAVTTISALASIDPAVLNSAMDSAEVEERLRRGNAELKSIGCNERPSWLITNANGDRVTMQGVWQSDAVLSVIHALRRDEAAYASAGSPPQ